MCIINDQFDLCVFYVYGSNVEFKRYKNKRYKPMKQFNKKKLHNFSRFAMKNNTGLIHPTFKNVFLSKKMTDNDGK